MDGFSVRARAAVELGQQSENALSFLNRKTAGNTVNARGTAWPRDDAKRGAICQIVVRDTGLRRGEVLWRSVGLLVDGIGETKDVQVVSTRAAFSDAFAAQYATCLFYKADGTALVWECGTDVEKFFFPPADLDPSLAPAMLSCAALDTAAAAGLSRLRTAVPPASTAEGDQEGVAAATRSSPPPDCNVESGREEGAGMEGMEGGAISSRERGVDAIDGERPPHDERGDGSERRGVVKEAAATGGQRHDRRACRGGGDIGPRGRVGVGGSGDGGVVSGGGGGGGDGYDVRGADNGSGVDNVKKAVTGKSLLRPFFVDLTAEVSHAHPQILHLGETIHLFQPPEVPGGSWEEMEAITWAIEQNPDGQVSVKYRVDPRGDRDMVEGCPLLKKIGGRKYVPVGLHLGRFTEKEWTHHGLLLLSGMHQIGEWLGRERAKKERTAEGRIGEEKTSHRKVMRERTKAHLSTVVNAGALGQPGGSGDREGLQASPSKLVTLSPEEGEALAEACEGQGAQAVLAIVLAPEGVDVVRRPGLKALARLASGDRQALLEIGRSGGIEAAIALLRELGEHRDVQENACWLLALLSQVAEFSRSIGKERGCEEVCQVLRRCAKFGGACPRIQSWALGCVANLLVCSENRRRILGGGPPSRNRGVAAEEEQGKRLSWGSESSSRKGEEEESRRQREGTQQEESGDSSRQGERKDGGGGRGNAKGGGRDAASAASSSSRSSSGSSSGLADWIHTVLANSERVACDRGAQYAGIACVREVAAAGPIPARAMRLAGVPGIIVAAVERFGSEDPGLRDLASHSLRCLSSG